MWISGLFVPPVAMANRSIDQVLTQVDSELTYLVDIVKLKIPSIAELRGLIQSDFLRLRVC